MQAVANQPLIERYRRFLPVSERTPVITLKEGSTPLIRARRLEHRLEEEAGVRLEVHLKVEGANPTGSFKDRGMTMALSKAVEEGTEGVICASTGNTSASAAAYAAKAGVPCFVVIPDGNIAMGKLAQAVMHGARVLAIRGNFDRALEMVVRISERIGMTLVNSLNPYRIDGQKSAAWEIADDLGDAPDYHFIPVGNAGNITAYWAGYRIYREAGLSRSLPKMMGFQAAGAAPIVEGAPVADPKTIATAIKIGNPASWKKAVAARDESGGVIEKVTDDEILEAYRLLAALEGVFCEPASAASVAGLLKLSRARRLAAGARLACTLTGHGLKDPERAITFAGEPVRLEADFDAVLKEVARP
ncbi:MAG: threonine synthase [Planctomycetes bacterium]|nr:threonine synthase [Planctomycetota bacterium]